jgi:hypothetical protein
MKVSLDGGLTWKDSDNVRVLYDNLEIVNVRGDEIHNVTLLLNATSEGLVTYIWSEQENIGTDSATAEEIAERLV